MTMYMSIKKRNGSSLGWRVLRSSPATREKQCIDRQVGFGISSR